MENKIDLTNSNETSKDINVSIPEKPIMLKVKWENIPEYLKKFSDFFFWKYVLENGKYVKHPICEWSKPEERHDFQTMKNLWDALKNKDEIGLGFGFNMENDLIGIDIDKCIDGSNPNSSLTQTIDDLIKNIDCYTEVSPSKTGVHIIGRVKDKTNVPATVTSLIYSGCDHIEYYPKGRWFAMTGYHDQRYNDITFIDEIKLKNLVGDKIKPEPFKMPEVVEAGGRNNMLFKLACSMRSKGLSESSIQAALREENILKCKPPLQENDIITIAGQAAKYNPSSPIKVEDLIKQVSIEELSKLKKFDQTKPLNYAFKDDLIFKYIDFHKDMSDAYVDFHHGDALVVLSTIIDRKAVLYTRQTTVYPNIWIYILAQSTIGRKTTVINQIYDFSHILHRSGRVELPKQFSPESLVEILSESSHGYFINDESAGLMKSMQKKSYMADARDIFCGLYENRGFSRKLRTKKAGDKSEFIVTDPYVTKLYATTPSNISRYADYDDFASGWLIRFLYYYPNYEKPYMGLTEATNEDFQKKNKLTQDISQLEEFFAKLSEPVRFIFSENANIFFTEWCKNLETQMSNMDDDILQAAAGRLEIYAIKLAMIYEIAKNDFIDNFKELEGLMGKIDSWDGMDFKYPISLPVIQEACREIDEYFLPMAKRVSQLIEEGDLRNDQVSIINVLKRKGGQASRTEVARMTHLSAKQLREAIDALVNDSDQIEVLEAKDEGSCKPTTYLRMKEEKK